MIRLSLLRFTIAVSKAAIAISDSLKPATWKRIAIAHFLVGLSFLLVYGFLDRSDAVTEIPPVHIAQLEPVPLFPSPSIDFINPTATVRGQSVSVVGSNFTAGTTVVILINASNSTSFIAYQDSAWSTPVFTGGSEVALSSIGDSVPGGWKLPSIGAPEPHLVLQPVSADRQSLLETVLKLIMLFQGVTTMVNGSLASIFACIAYHRAKVDLAVKQVDLEIKRLQILQIQQQLDKQARERLKEVEDAVHSRIILVR